MVTEQQLFKSLKDLSDEIYVQRAYLALLGRPADPTGYHENLRRMRDGTSREDVWEALAESAESRSFRGGAPRIVPDGVAAGSGPKAKPRISHVRDLLSLYGASFVRAAYLAILGREADPEGLALYVAVLRAGKSRSYVLAELVGSTEAREKSQRLPGLDVLIRNYLRAQMPSWRGWYWRAVRGAESDLPASCETRMLAYAAIER